MNPNQEAKAYEPTNPRLSLQTLFLTGLGCLFTYLVMVIAMPLPSEAHLRDPSRNSRPSERALADGLSFDGVPVKQVALQFESGEALVQLYPTNFEPFPKFEVYSNEYAKLHAEKNNPWYEGFERGQFLTTYNCVAFAVGRDVGLEPGDHVDPIAQQGFESPLAIILRDRYEQVASFDRGNFDRIEKEIEPGNVICFWKTDGRTEHAVHVARAHAELDEMRLLSKMGRRGPVLLTNLKFLVRHYSQTSVIRIYRLRSSDT